MKSEYGCYVLMLVYVDEDWMDIGGNVYPIEGYVETKNFTDDIDIRTGLYGILWGRVNIFPYERIDKGNWLIVKTELSEDLIKTDWESDRYKFRSGMVVYAGNLRSAAKYIMKHKGDFEFSKESKWLRSEEIAGTKEWLKEHDIRRRCPRLL